MSKAVFIDDYGEPDALVLRERDVRAPGPGEISVKNAAIGVNFIDNYQRRGLYPVALPAVLGQEGAGLVEAVGEGVEHFKAGDRVAYLSGGGAYAEETIVSAAMAAKIPEGVSNETAAAVFLKGLTTEMLVRQVYKLSPDDTCVVYAAAGGVGSLLTQWASDIGARVIAIVGSPDKASDVQSYGADHIIIRTQTDSIAGEVRRLTDGQGANVVYDSVGAETFEASLDSLALRGHMVTYGNASGPAPAVQPLDLSRRGSLTLTRPSLFHYATPDRLPAMAKALFEKLASGALTPRIAKKFSLADVADAHRLLESGKSAGAIILEP